MDIRNRHRRFVDPEQQRWDKRYRRFPGVAECARLIRAGKARGTWAEIIAHELADNAQDTLPELIAEFELSNGDDVALYILIALEFACLPESTEFLGEVLQSGDLRLAEYARRTLSAINTREARRVLLRSPTRASRLRGSWEPSETVN